MFKTPKDYKFSNDSPRVKNKDFLISPQDRLEMHFYSIEGFKLVDVTNATGPAQSGPGMEEISYLVEDDGRVKLPVIGKVPITGMTISEAEHFLEEKYSKDYIDPFILLRITNRHVYVFFAENGRGVTINLQNNNTTIIDAIALAGGLTETSKAWRIKVIRGDLQNPQIHIVDLSTIEGLKSSNLVIQSNDIIYIEAVPNYSQKVLNRILPLIGILTAALLVVNLINK